MKRMLSTVSFAVIAAFLASSAQAADIFGGAAKDGVVVGKKDAFEGPYVAIGGGYLASKVEGTEFSGDKVEIDLDDFLASARIGYDTQHGSFVIGGWGAVTWRGDGAYGVDQDEFSYELALRAGIVSGAVLFYGAAGVEVDQADVGNPEFEDKSDLDYARLFAALGAETQLGNGIFVNLEGRHTFKSGEEAGEGVSDGLLDGSDVERHDWSIRAHIGKRF